MSRVIQWRPKKAARTPPASPEDLWTMRKQEWQVHCAVEPRGQLGWAIRVHINGHWFFWCEFESYDAALEAAEVKYRELSTGGWTPATPTQTAPSLMN